MPLPDLDYQSKMRALDKAADARKIRAEFKQQLKAGEIDFREVLRRAEHDKIVAKTKVIAVLESMPRVGKVRARRLMERLNIAFVKSVGGLGVHQKERLLREFDGGEPPP